jgi:hypothetical protein
VFRLIEYRVRADRRTTVTETHKHSPDTTTSTCTSPSTHHAIHAHERAVTGGTVAVRGAATRFSTEGPEHHANQRALFSSKI